MILVKRSKVRIRGIKGKFEGKEEGLLILEILEKLRKEKELGEKRKKGEKERTNPSQNQHPLEKRKEILHSKEFSYSNHL